MIIQLAMQTSRIPARWSPRFNQNCLPRFASNIPGRLLSYWRLALFRECQEHGWMKDRTDLGASSPVSASTREYLMRCPVILLIWLKLIFSESEAAG
jgi:hypothetical protein